MGKYGGILTWLCAAAALSGCARTEWERGLPGRGDEVAAAYYQAAKPGRPDVPTDVDSGDGRRPDGMPPAEPLRPADEVRPTEGELPRPPAEGAPAGQAVSQVVGRQEAAQVRLAVAAAQETGFPPNVLK